MEEILPHANPKAKKTMWRPIALSPRWLSAFLPNDDLWSQERPSECGVTIPVSSGYRCSSRPDLGLTARAQRDALFLGPGCAPNQPSSPRRVTAPAFSTSLAAHFSAHSCLRTVSHVTFFISFLSSARFFPPSQESSLLVFFSAYALIASVGLFLSFLLEMAPSAVLHTKQG